MGNCCDCDDEPAVELDEPSSAPENEDGIGPLQSTQSFPVLKAGWVLLQGEVVKSVWKRRWLELSADALRYYKKEGGKDYNISPDVVVLMQDILNVQRETQHGVRLVLVSADAAMRRQKRTSRSWIEATMKGANANRVGRRSAKSARSSHFQCEDDYDRDEWMAEIENAGKPGGGRNGGSRAAHSAPARVARGSGARANGGGGGGGGGGGRRLQLPHPNKSLPPSAPSGSSAIRQPLLPHPRRSAPGLRTAAAAAPVAAAAPAPPGEVTVTETMVAQQYGAIPTAEEVTHHAEEFGGGAAPAAPPAPPARATPQLPAGWVALPSKSRPGTMSYMNVYTGKKVRTLPRNAAVKAKAAPQSTGGKGKASGGSRGGGPRGNGGGGGGGKPKLPEGWKRVPSKSRPGTFSYQNIYTREKVRHAPTKPASRTKGQAAR